MTKRSLLAVFGISLSAFAPSLDAAVIDLSKPVSQSITPDKLYWAFDETSGTSAANSASSGSAYDGTLRAGAFTTPTFAPGVSAAFGNSVALAGASKGGDATKANPYVNWVGTASDTALDLVNEDFTGGMWVNFNTMASAAQTVILLNRGTYGLANSFSVALIKTKNSATNLYQWQVSVLVGDSAGSETKMSSYLDTSAIATGEWFNLGFTYDYRGDVGQENQVKLYLNGAALETLNFSKSISVTSTQRKLAVGERTVSSFYSVFDGRIDDAFLTSGVQSFAAVPEPSSVALGLVGVSGVFLFLKSRKALHHP